MDKISEFRGEHRWLSNFAYIEIEYHGCKYPSVENAYQAAKGADFENDPLFEHITPGEAKKLGRQLRMRVDWNDVRDEVMLHLTRIKYKSDRYKKLLLATGDAEIVEGNYWRDTYWGVCNGVGQNRLGKIIMKVREEMKT